MALPTFFIVGAAKAGTTSLHYYLDQHPQVQMSANKEPHFFAGASTDIPFPMGRVDSLSDYEHLFDASAEVRGEASPSYTAHPRRQGAPERIKALVPEAKFVYLVRDPIARTVSHFQHAVAAGNEKRTLTQALTQASDPYSYLTCQSFYARQVRLYLEHFPEGNLMVIDQAELLSERRATLKRIFAFLSVDDGFDSAQFDDELLKSRERYVATPVYTRFLKAVTGGRIAWIPPSVRRSVRRTFERTFLSPVSTPALDDKSRERLTALYADDIEDLRRLTGKSFSTWRL
jgi:Sulfotransferase family